MLAWGIVPTGEDVQKDNIDDIFDKFTDVRNDFRLKGLEHIGEASFITPSCGCGNLSVDCANRIMELTIGLAQKLNSA